MTLQQFSGQVFGRQRMLHARLKKPLLDQLSVMLLSRPIKEIHGDTLIMDFFGVFWVYSSWHHVGDFFDTVDAAVQFVQAQVSQS